MPRVKLVNIPIQMVDFLARNVPRVIFNQIRPHPSVRHVRRAPIQLQLARPIVKTVQRALALARPVSMTLQTVLHVPNTLYTIITQKHVTVVQLGSIVQQLQTHASHAQLVKRLNRDMDVNRVLSGHLHVTIYVIHVGQAQHLTKVPHPRQIVVWKHRQYVRTMPI